MKAEKWGEEEGGDEDCKEKAAAAALVTQLATALVCSALPCHSKLSSSCYESSAVVKVTSYLDWGKKNLHIQKMSFQMLASTWSLYVFSIYSLCNWRYLQLGCATMRNAFSFSNLQYGLQTLPVLYVTLWVFPDEAAMKMKDSNDTSWNIHSNAV